MSQSEKFQRQRLNRDQGYALVMVLALGMMMSLMGMGLILRSQQDVAIATGRKDSGKVGAIAEGGVARTLALLKQPQNAALLTRNYDPINLRTGRTYLGADSALNSGDETATAVDQWTGYDPSTKSCYQQAGVGAPNMPLSGTLGTGGSYTLRAYRYDPQKQRGTVLVEAQTAGQSSAVSVSFTVHPVLDDFPGISTFSPVVDPLWPAGTIALRGREVLGRKGNIYYNPVGSANPALTGNSPSGDASRPSYLDAIFSATTQDGATGDTVSGTIFGCSAFAFIPDGIRGTNFGVINTSQTLSGVGGTVPTLYQADQINLSNNDVLTVDTTNGPVRLDMVDTGNAAIVLRNNAKILNIRTDGKPPRVGDLRILIRGGLSSTELYDQSCLQNAFLWSYFDELRLLTSGPGCPSGRNTNFEGVVWAEAVLSSKNAVGNRDINYLGVPGYIYDTMVTPGATSGIFVPDDLSSLSDLLRYIDWPVQYQFGDIKTWQRQRL